MKMKIIILVIIIILFLISLISFIKEINNKNLYPLTFSEISQLKRIYKDKLDDFTLVYAMINDICMKIYESHNKAKLGIYKDYKYRVAQELDFHTDMTFNFHRHSLYDLLEQLPNQIDKCLSKENLVPILKVYNHLLSISKVYYEDHEDSYHTEVYTYTDSNGNLCTGTRQVYDYTDHTFLIYKDKTPIISNYLIELKTINFPNLQPILKPIEVEADGGYATEQSLKKLGYKNISYFDDKSLNKFVLDWGNRTYYNIYLPSMQTSDIQVKNSLDLFNQSVSIAEDFKVRTYSHDYPRPEWMNNIISIENNIDNVQSRLSLIVNNLENIKKDIIPLRDEIKGYITYYIFDKKESKIKNNNKIFNIANSWMSMIYQEKIRAHYNCWTFVFFLMLIILIIYIIYLTKN